MEDDFTIDQREKMEAEAKRLADQRASESATESAKQLAIEEARSWAREEKRRAFRTMYAQRFEEFAPRWQGREQND